MQQSVRRFSSLPNTTTFLRGSCGDHFPGRVPDLFLTHPAAAAHAAFQGLRAVRVQVGSAKLEIQAPPGAGPCIRQIASQAESRHVHTKTDIQISMHTKHSTTVRNVHTSRGRHSRPLQPSYPFAHAYIHINMPGLNKARTQACGHVHT